MQLEAMRVGDFAVVVLTYGVEPRHGDLVKELRKQGIVPENVTVVHNPITSGAPDRRIVDGIEIVRNETNLGYSGAVNVGLRQASVRTASAVLILTDDVSIAGDALEESVKAMEASARVGVFGMAMYHASGEIFSYGGISLRGGIVKHIRDQPDSRTLLECDWVDGAAWIFRTEVLEQIGLLDERYFMYFEEPLMCAKAKRSGWGVATILNARVTQSPGGDKRPAAQAYLLARNSLHYAFLSGGLLNAAIGVLRWFHSAWTEHGLSKDHSLQSKERERHALRRVGMLRGIRAAICRQWGPPPPDLPGPSDIFGLS